MFYVPLFQDRVLHLDAGVRGMVSAVSDHMGIRWAVSFTAPFWVVAGLVLYFARRSIEADTMARTRRDAQTHHRPPRRRWLVAREWPSVSYGST